MKKITLGALLLFSGAIFGQTWTQVANNPLPRHHPISFSLNGKGYAVTGSLSNGNPSNNVYEYDPGTDTWTPLANFPGQARSFGIGAVTNGLAYVGFGATTTQYLNDFWSFDAGTGTWTQLSSCSCSGRRHPALIAIGDRIYVGLGDDATGNLADFWMYDIPTDTWSQIPNIPGPSRHHPYMFKAGNDVYAGFGHAGNTIYDDWYQLDTASNTWTTMNVFQGEARVAGTQFEWNGKGYVLSGDGDNHSWMATGEMWEYDHLLDTWTQLTPHPGQSRWAPGSFVINNDVYFFGGYNRLTQQYPNDTWKFGLGTTTGLAEQEGGEFRVYPNPANSFIAWKTNKNITTISVYNALGQVVVTEAANTQRIDVQNLKNGMYFVHLYNGSDLISTQKIIIQH